MYDYEEKYNNLINTVAEIRALILKHDPAYDKYLCEMCACPQACTEVIKQWVEEKIYSK